MWEEITRTQVSLAFEVPGGWHDEKTTVTTSVLQRLMGGGSSFSTGGLGKLCILNFIVRILSNYHQIESFYAFSNIYNRTRRFGINATTSPDFASKAVDLAARELLEVATPGKVTQEELDRAKQATKSTVLLNLESRTIASKDMGRQILTYGERKPIESFLKDVEEVTLNDISSVAKKIISSPLQWQRGAMLFMSPAKSLSAASSTQSELD